MHFTNKQHFNLYLRLFSLVSMFQIHQGWTANTPTNLAPESGGLKSDSLAWITFKAAVCSVVMYKYCLWLAACQGRSRLPGPNFHFCDIEKEKPCSRHACVRPALRCICLTAMTAAMTERISRCTYVTKLPLTHVHNLPIFITALVIHSHSQTSFSWCEGGGLILFTLEYNSLTAEKPVP